MKRGNLYILDVLNCVVEEHFEGDIVEADLGGNGDLEFGIFGNKSHG